MEVTQWRYYLGTGDTYKEYSFQNTSESKSYAFCLTPQTKTLHMTSTDFRYSASGYPQRIYTRSADLTNSTTNQLLYLLSDADGSYFTLIVQNAYGSPIAGVTIVVERQFTGVWTEIGRDDTDTSGSSTFWVNPDYDHKFTLSKSGYVTQELTIRPTSTSQTVVFGSTNTSAAEYTSSIKGISYSISPNRYTTLNKSQTYEFQFNVTANQSNLVSYLFNITDFNGNLLGSDGGSVAVGSQNSITLNTGTNKSFNVYYFIDVGTGVQQIDFNRYVILTVNASDGSLVDAVGNEDIDNKSIEDQFAYFFWFWFILFILLAAFTKFTSADLMQPGTILVFVGVIILVLSIMNFFTVSFSPYDYINQYGLFLLYFMWLAGFIMNQMSRS
jgi:hypothetical protein